MYYKIIFILLLVTYNTSLSAQISAFIIDSETKTPIPYANIGIANERTGTFTNDEGKFVLKNISSEKRLIVTAIGYEKSEISTLDISDTIYLKPQIIELSEVKIRKKQNSQKLKIGNIKGKIGNILTFYPNPNYNVQFIAKYFEPNTKYEYTPFLKQIKIRTHSYRDDFIINIAIYSVGKNNEPRDYLYNKNLLYTIKKGWDQIQCINLSGLNIELPVDGFFIVFETLPNLNQKKNNPNDVVTYDLNSLGLGYVLLKSKKNTNTWLTETNGNWSKEKEWSLPVELELSN